MLTLDRRPRLIIADDDPVVVAMLQGSLSSRFDVVGCAGDSEQVIELARANQPDAAVIDVEMPKGGGLAAVKGILEVAPDTAIVVFSSDESDSVVRELMEAGAIAYRRKGVAPEVLADSLTESIRVLADSRNRKLAQEHLVPSPVDRLFEMSLVMLGTASTDGYFTQLNPCWERTLGWTSEELMAKPFLSFVHPEDVEATMEQSAELADPDGAEVIGFENRYRTRDGDYRWISWSVAADGEVLYFVAKDISEQRAADVAREQAVSVTDAIIESVADGLYVADSDGLLTFINPAGVLLLGYESQEELLGRDPHATFHHTRADGAPYPLSDCPLARVSLTGLPAHADEEWFWRQDGSALPVSYTSTPVELGDGTGSVVAFRDITEIKERELRVRGELESLSWVGRIRDALKEDRFALYAQPIVDLKSGETIQHELLVRMIGAGGEVILPAEFLPVAEQHGLIGAIDRCVFDLAMAHAAAGHCVQINLSAESISDPGLFRFVQRGLQAHNVDPRLVVFEITETALIQNEAVAQVFIESVRRLHCSVALDDFGTGYGSFRYLKRLPVTLLKIDQEFVRDLEGEAADVNRHVIQAIVTLARGMGQKTVAEGVETEGTRELLRTLGVDYGQGYLFARPAPAAEVFRSIEEEGEAHA
jgi:PAS domain S-box-containing protein